MKIKLNITFREKILCFLGFHNWIFKDSLIGNERGLSFCIFQCDRCYKKLIE